MDAVLPSTHQRTAVQGPSPTVGKLWVEMAAGQGAGHSAQIPEEPRGALGSRGMTSAALSSALRTALVNEPDHGGEIRVT